MQPALETQQESRVLRLILNRPEKQNVLGAELCDALSSSLSRAWRDPSVGAILIEARGDVFCGGLDFEQTSGEDWARLETLLPRVLSAAERSPKPIVASVSGPAIGCGLALVATAHVALAAQGVSFGLTEMRVGTFPYVAWAPMAAAIGERRTLGLALTGRIFSVNEALQWGVIHEVTPQFELDDRATATAHHLADASQGLNAGLKWLRERRRTTLSGLGEAVEAQKQSFATPDFHEGMQAQRERRRPVWGHFRKPVS